MADLCPHCGRKMPERDSDLQEMKDRWDGYEAARRSEPIESVQGLSMSRRLQWESGWQIGQQARKFGGVKIT